MKNLKSVVSAGFAVVALSAGQAFAALPTEVTGAITDAKADGLTVAGGFLAAVIVISALLIARRGAKG